MTTQITVSKHHRWQSEASRFHEGILEKECHGCGLVLPLSKFKSKGSAYVVEGRKQYHAQCNRCLYVKYTRPAADQKMREIHEYQLKMGCADCGYREHPAALEIDHRPGTEKLFNIGEQMGNYSRSKLWAEIEKCDVVCANCHNIRTHDRRERVDLT